MQDKDVEAFAKELSEIKKPNSKQKVKRVCPICSGERLKKEKVIFNNQELNIEIREELGRMVIQIFNQEDEEIYKSSFPIKYCPCCGRKVKDKYKKSK